MTSTDHYATLGVPESAPHATIQAAYRRIIRSVHPDVAGDDPVAAATTVRANQAWAVLKDPTRRADYDRQRSVRTGPTATNGTATAGQTPSWGPGGIRPVTIEQLREAAARESAYGQNGRVQRDAFSAASRRVGVTILLIGAIMLALVAAR